MKKEVNIQFSGKFGEFSALLGTGGGHSDSTTLLYTNNSSVDLFSLKTEMKKKPGAGKAAKTSRRQERLDRDMMEFPSVAEILETNSNAEAEGKYLVL